MSAPFSVAPVHLPAFTAPYAEAEEAVALRLLADPDPDQTHAGAIDRLATRLVQAVRGQNKGAFELGGLEDFLHAYSLTTEEGLALMGLAEALLRVPDAATADRLIEDKLAHVARGMAAQEDDPAAPKAKHPLLVSASAWALALSNRLIRPGQTPETVLGGLVKRLGLPTIRTATRQAVRILGHQFVLGETIEAALGKARSGEGRAWRWSFDMLGEGARTAADADTYAQSYADAIRAIGRQAGEAQLPQRAGISIKLSALHPRFEPLQEGRVLAELPGRLLDLARAAKAADLAFTVDAEEADRLSLSLKVIQATLADPSLTGWEGFGLAIQAYQKRALAVIAWSQGLAHALERRIMVRLVKGAYWDTEIKRGQERGLDDYPVLTRKAGTDLNYLAAARAMLQASAIFPMFATHNALTVAQVLALAERAGIKPSAFEFQRLHGMGESIYTQLQADYPAIACRVYAPVGGHTDLLAYLVRRLLENGANSSFVSAAADPAVPVAALLTRPRAILGSAERARHAGIPQPRALYAPERANSRGLAWGDEAALRSLTHAVEGARRVAEARPLIDGKPQPGVERPVLSPIDRQPVGRVWEAAPTLADPALKAAFAGFGGWSRAPLATRAAALERAADLIEERRAGLIHLLEREAGKTLDDAIAEVREAADFCRYYAAQARGLFGGDTMLPGPTGESNRIRHRGRGVFVCISPWNFPLAIFTGQIVAALVAGNAVVAKPAEQTPLIAAATVALLLDAGIPPACLQLLPGDGAVGAALVAHPLTGGVAFTGSTATARAINRALAARETAPIVPLIAETGGINAMLVDATSLPEQVTDDVVISAFKSAGQRCSALRLLLLQEDVAPHIARMIEGAAAELVVGDPGDLATDLGPVIDAKAQRRLEAHIASMRAAGHKVVQPEPAGGLRGHRAEGGFWMRPTIIHLARPDQLAEEVFGPVLHIATWKPADLDPVLASIEVTGYGLTLGVHTRIETMADRVIQRLSVGNIYVNRSMIGAVVGTQPFGGAGLSGTGPKAGGPDYLRRFATEQVVSVNTAAAGGNASLVMLGDQG